MAVAVVGRSSWPHRPARGHDSRGLLSDRSQADQGPAQDAADVLDDTRGSVLLGGSVLSTITLLLSVAMLDRRRAQVADTWTFGVGVVVILLGL